ETNPACRSILVTYDLLAPVVELTKVIDGRKYRGLAARIGWVILDRDNPGLAADLYDGKLLVHLYEIGINDAILFLGNLIKLSITEPSNINYSHTGALRVGPRAFFSLAICSTRRSKSLS